MKRKAVGFIFALLMLAVFLYGCGGGGGHSNPAASNNTGLARVSGKIVDSAQKPVADVKVRLALTTNSLVNSLPNEIKNTLRLSTTDNSTEFNTTTDKNGQYRFENVPYGRYSLSVNAGDQGALLPNLEVSSALRAVDEQTIKPFGFVTGKVVTKENNKEIPVYGAMVSVSELSQYTAFTNNEGVFTLRYIPVGTEYSLSATLQGYTTQTATFTIPATELEYTLPQTANPIELEATASNYYSIPVTLSVSDSIVADYPIYAIAQDEDNHSNVFFTAFPNKETKSSVIKISKASNTGYKLFALSTNRFQSEKTPTITVSQSSIDEKKTHDTITLELKSSSPEPKTVVIKKLELPVNDYVDNTPNYFDGFVSCIGKDGEMHYSSLEGEITDPVSLDTIYDICGKNVVQCNTTPVSGNQISIFGMEHNNEGILATISSSSISINCLGFIPQNYLGVGYSYIDGLDENGCSIYKYYVDTLKYNISTSKYNGEANHYCYNNLPVADLKMFKFKESVYMAVLFSSNSTILKIYEVGTGNELITYNYPSTLGIDDYPSISKFQVVNNNFCYVDITITNKKYDDTNLDNPITYSYSTQAYVFKFNNNKPEYTSSSSKRKSFYLDSNGNMYRFDSEKNQIIKCTSLDDENATPIEVDTISSDPNKNIFGILGFEENADTVTIYAY